MVGASRFTFCIILIFTTALLEPLGLGSTTLETDAPSICHKAAAAETKNLETMVILVESDDGNPSYAPARSLSSLSTSTSSSSSSSSDDPEEGGYSSQEEATIDVAIVSKCVSHDRHGRRPPRRRSQSERATCRRRSQLVAEALRCDAQRRHHAAPRSAPPPRAFRRGRSAGPPGTICIESDPAKPSPTNKRPPLLTAFFALFNLALLVTVVVQQVQLRAHREELAVTNQHRMYMDNTNANLQSQLAARDASLKQYRRAQDRMTRSNAEMAERLGKLKEEREEARSELERLRGAELRAEADEESLEGYGEEYARDGGEEYADGQWMR